MLDVGLSPCVDSVVKQTPYSSPPPSSDRYKTAFKYTFSNQHIFLLRLDDFYLFVCTIFKHCLNEKDCFVFRVKTENN